MHRHTHPELRRVEGKTIRAAQRRLPAPPPLPHRWCWATPMPCPSTCGAWAAWRPSSSWACRCSRAPASTTFWAASSGGSTLGGLGGGGGTWRIARRNFCLAGGAAVRGGQHTHGCTRGTSLGSGGRGGGCGVCGAPARGTLPTGRAQPLPCPTAAGPNPHIKPPLAPLQHAGPAARLPAHQGQERAQVLCGGGGGAPRRADRRV